MYPDARGAIEQYGSGVVLYHEYPKKEKEKAVKFAEDLGYNFEELLKPVEQTIPEGIQVVNLDTSFSISLSSDVDPVPVIGVAIIAGVVYFVATTASGGSLAFLALACV